MLDCLASYGVVGDGLKNDTAALQNAVDDCASSGGGKITLQGGKTYLVGTLTLKSHIEIHFEAGSILKATPNSSDFNVSFGGVALNDSNSEHGDTEKPTVMLNAENAENISITGTGTLDGSGRDYILKDRGSIYEMSLRRPFTIYFRSCNNITFRDVRIIDGALWTLRLSVCEDVVISGVRIHNDVKIPNSDAIDLDCCKRVRISDCDLVAGDDAICLKACLEHTRDSKERVCQDVTITGCTITTTSAAIKVGTECQTAIRNVTISSCIVHNSSRGLCIRLAEGGHIANILCTNIILQSSFPDQLWWGRGEAIAVVAVPRSKSMGTISNLRFRDILCRSENGVFVYTEQPGAIQGLVMDNVRVEIDRWSGWEGGFADLRPCKGDPFREMPTNAFHFENADRIIVRNCEVIWTAKPKDAKYAVYSKACGEFNVEGTCYTPLDNTYESIKIE